MRVWKLLLQLISSSQLDQRASCPISFLLRYFELTPQLRMSSFSNYRCYCGFTKNKKKQRIFIIDHAIDHVLMYHRPHLCNVYYHFFAVWASGVTVLIIVCNANTFSTRFYKSLQMKNDLLKPLPFPMSVLHSSVCFTSLLFLYLSRTYDDLATSFIVKR